LRGLGDGCRYPTQRKCDREMSDLIVTTIVVIAVLMVFSWIGDWTGSRMRRKDNAYWLSSGVACPECDRPFTGDEIASRGDIIVEHQFCGAVLTCSACQVAFEFFRDKTGPSYMCRSPQLRRCLQCDNCYNGVEGDQCPSCESMDSTLDHDSAFGVARESGDGG